MGGLAGQLGTREVDLPNRLAAPTISFGVIAGDRWINPVGPWLLPAPDDGTFSVASTRLSGMSDHLIVPHTHTFIMNSAEVVQALQHQIVQGKQNRTFVVILSPVPKARPRTRPVGYSCRIAAPSVLAVAKRSPVGLKAIFDGLFMRGS